MSLLPRLWCDHVEVSVCSPESNDDARLRHYGEPRRFPGPPDNLEAGKHADREDTHRFRQDAGFEVGLNRVTYYI